MNSPVDINQKLGNEITLLAGLINAASYQLLKLIARFDDAKAWSGGGTVPSCAHWLNWKCGIALGAARKSAGGPRAGNTAADRPVFLYRINQLLQSPRDDPRRTARK